jgi:transketolase
MDILKLQRKADWVRRETLALHRRCPETRVASSLSCVELLTALFYGKILRFDASKPSWPLRDRFIISKGHGSISFFPILADLGIIDPVELDRIGLPEGELKAIPDPMIPGYETINGSLGHGLGVGAGAAVMLRHCGSDARVAVLLGDGELFEGAVWEAVMFAAHKKLSNLMLILDLNGASMLDFCRNIIDLRPIEARLQAFGWETTSIHEGHDMTALLSGFSSPATFPDRPRAFAVYTVKGKGVPALEQDPMSHVRVLSTEAIDAALAVLP